jgi:polysaccharide export outer membrane protein
VFQKPSKSVDSSERYSRRFILLGAAAATVSACAPQTTFPITQAGQKTLVDRDVRVIRVTRDNVARLTAEYVAPDAATGNPPRDSSRYTYRVGVGDGLDIRIWTGPERSSAQGSLVPPRPIVVEETGKFFYPYVGDVPAAGRSVAEIRDYLTQALSEYIAMPQVEVSVADFVSRRVTLTGEVTQQGETILTNNPLRLLSLVNNAAPTDEADLSAVTISRAGRKYTVNLEAFITKGIGSNPILLPNDIVTVPRLDGQSIYVFGEVPTRELPINVGETNVTSVLAQSGGLDKLRADTRGVFVFRRSGPVAGGYDVYQIDLQTADAYLIASQMAVLPQDILYVTSDPITRVTDNITKVLSPVTGIAGTASAGRALATE